MTPSSYSLEIDHLWRATGPLALIAPQAVQAAANDQTLVRVLDDGGQAARVRILEGQLLTSWDQPNELFPSEGNQPPWIERLHALITDLELA